MTACCPRCPPQLFKELRSAQQASHQQVVARCQGVAALGPPALSAAAVAAWCSACRQEQQAWGTTVADLMARCGGGSRSWATASAL